MSQGPAITICVGATKAGTSWLYNAMAAHPECGFRTVKELHYFDSIRDGQTVARVNEFKTEKARLKRKLDTVGVAKQMELNRRIADLRDWISVLSRPHSNFAAYLGFLTAGNEAQRVVGEVTPAYATLPEQTLRDIADMADDVRIIYLMRDPVARIWSHVRMVAGRNTTDPAQFERSVAAKLDLLLDRDPLMAKRGDYVGALDKLRAAVAPARLLTMFTEDLMTPAGLERLWDFLGVKRVATDLSRRVYEGLPLAMTDDQRRRARVALQPQYAGVGKLFADLPEVWRRNMEEVLA